MITAIGGVPFATTIVGIITAVATLLTAGTALIAVLPALFKLKAEVKAARSDVQSVHKIVNQQRTDMQRYERALVAALKQAGVDIPVDQSIDPTEAEPPQER